MSNQEKEEKKEKQGRGLRILLYILILILLILIILLVRSCREQQGENPDLEALRDRIKVTDTPAPDTAPPETKPPETTSSPDTTGSDTEEDTFPIPDTTAELPPLTPDRSVLLDFASLREVNSEIRAWLEIPDSRIDYPVLQSPYYDKKYLTTGFDGSYYIGGALFTEKTYNNPDFNDPVTIIYGHTMRSGNLFGQLQSLYSVSDSFETHREMHLYLPGEHRVYRVFAAVPFPSYHILYTFDFHNPDQYRYFFSEIMNTRSLLANMDRTCFPSPGDKVLILSTCLTSDNTQRFLVMGVLEE